MAEIETEKHRLRREARALRAELQSAERDGKTTEHFLSAFSAEVFFVYISHGTETGTKELIKNLLQAGKRVLVPKLVAGEMKAVPLAGGLARNKYGILEPLSGEDEPAELCVTPLLAVDKDGYRLGYGGGYYDKYFASHQSVLRVGFCYAGQAFKKLPHGEFDIPLDAIVTEEGTVRYERKKLDSFPSNRV